jgi:hypothetical protein
LVIWKTFKNEKQSGRHFLLDIGGDWVLQKGAIYLWNYREIAQFCKTVRFSLKIQYFEQFCKTALSPYNSQGK